MRDPKILLNNNFAGKPEDIYLFLGRHPSGVWQLDGDRQMLEYTQAGGGASLEMLVLHDDATREYAYGPAKACLTLRSEPFLRRSMTRPKQKAGRSSA